MEYIRYLEKRSFDNKWKESRSKIVLENVLYYYALKEKVRLDAPTIVGLDVTSKCNLSCIHCFQTGRNLKEELSTEEWLTVIEQLKDMKVYQIYIMGGEPFFRKDILEIIKKIKQVKMTVSVNTNAMLITEKIAEELSKVLNPRFDYIQVSLDGATEKTNDEIRGKGVFAAVQSKIQLLKKYNIKVRVNSVINDSNYNQMTEIYKFCDKFKVDRVAFTTIYPYKREALLKVPEDSECILEFNRMLKCAESLGNRVLIEQDPICIPYKLDYFERYFVNNIKRVPELICRAGLYSCEIDAIGDVYPCTFMHHSQFKAGNIKEKQFKQIWCDDENWTTMLDKSRELNLICESCQFVNKCKGGCIAAGIDNSGNIGAGDPRCNIIREKI